MWNVKVWMNLLKKPELKVCKFLLGFYTKVISEEKTRDLHKYKGTLLDSVEYKLYQIRLGY